MRRQKIDLGPEVLHKAASDLLAIYGSLAKRRAHLLSDLMTDKPPLQWERLPADDAVDVAGRYQWFYHAHAPEDRPAGVEHGHFHLFARQPLWKNISKTAIDREFWTLYGNLGTRASTRHLIAIGVDPKGLPISMFTVNSWVTGDLMLGADATAQALAEIELETGYPDIDRMIVCLTRLCSEDVRRLLAQRDQTLKAHFSSNILEDRTIEILSEATFDLDERIGRVMRL